MAFFPGLIEFYVPVIRRHGIEIFFVRTAAYKGIIYNKEERKSLDPRGLHTYMLDKGTIHYLGIPLSLMLNPNTPIKSFVPEDRLQELALAMNTMMQAHLTPEDLFPVIQDVEVISYGHFEVFRLEDFNQPNEKWIRLETTKFTRLNLMHVIPINLVSCLLDVLYTQMNTKLELYHSRSFEYMFDMHTTLAKLFHTNKEEEKVYSGCITQLRRNASTYLMYIDQLQKICIQQTQIIVEKDKEIAQLKEKYSQDMTHTTSKRKGIKKCHFVTNKYQKNHVV